MLQIVFGYLTFKLLAQSFSNAGKNSSKNRWSCKTPFDPHSLQNSLRGARLQSGPGAELSGSSVSPGLPACCDPAFPAFWCKAWLHQRPPTHLPVCPSNAPSLACLPRAQGLSPRRAYDSWSNGPNLVLAGWMSLGKLLSLTISQSSYL